MPGSQTTPGPAGARTSAPVGFAFREVNNVGTRVYNAFAAQWLAYTLPYRRFAVVLAGGRARIGTCTTYSLPVSRRTHSRCGLHARAVTKIVTVIRRLQTFRHLHACSGCFRLER